MLKLGDIIVTVDATPHLIVAEAMLTRLLEVTQRSKINRLLSKSTAKLERELSRLFLKQGRDVSKALVKVRKYFVENAAEDFDKLFDKASLDTSTDMIDLIQDAAQTALMIGANQLIRDLGLKISFKLDNPRAVEYLENYGASRVTQIDETTKEDLKRLVLAGIANGESYDQVARLIKQKYTDMAKGQPQQHIDSRAHLIAVTEYGNAYQTGNYAAAATIKDSGIGIEKSWLTAGDSKVSQGCKDNAKQGWLDVEDDFSSGHLHPLRFPGCRCSTLYRRKGSTNG